MAAHASHVLREASQRTTAADAIYVSHSVRICTVPADSPATPVHLDSSRSQTVRAVRFVRKRAQDTTLPQELRAHRVIQASSRTKI
jgi:hypothetical protein